MMEHPHTSRPSRLRQVVAVLVTAAVLATGLSAPVAAAEPAPTTPTLTGTIRDAASAPVAGVYVVAFPVGGGTGTGDRTDEAGAYELALNAGTYRVTAFSPDPNPQLLADATGQVQVPGTLDLVMQTGTLTGTVRTPQEGVDGPVAGATVFAYGTSPENHAQATSGSDGTFALAVPDGTYTLAVDPPFTNPEGYVGTVETNVEVGSGGTTRTLRLRQPNVRGVVLGLDGAPVPGSRVYGVDAEGHQSAVDASSGPDGSYALLLPAGTWRIAAEPPYGAPVETGSGVREDVVVVDGAEPLTGQDVQLRPTTVRGTVRRPDGSVVQDSHVLATSADHPTQTTFTAASGEFGLRLAPGTTWTVVAHPADESDQQLHEGRRTVTVPAGDEVLLGQDIALRAANLTGRVLAPAGDAAVADALVTLQDAQDQQVGAAVVGSTGSFGFLVEPGEYVLRAQPPAGDDTGLLTTTQSVTVPVDDAVVQDVRFRQAAVAGQVLMPDGTTPAASARISVYDLVQRQPFELSCCTSASHQGRYALDLPAGRYRVSAVPEWSGDPARRGFRDVTVADAPLTGQDIALLTPGSRPFTAERVDVAHDPQAEPDGDVLDLALSDDGRTAVFTSFATNLVSPSVTGTHVYLRDLAAGTTQLLDGPLGAEVWFSQSPSMSGDGRFVAYASTRSDRDAGFAWTDVFVLDRQTGQTRVVSADADGAGLGGRDPVISDDGRFVVYLASDPGLTGRDDGYEAVVMTDLSDGSTSALSASGSYPYGHDLSGDGSTAAWYEEDSSGAMHVVRWSAVAGAERIGTPAAQPVYALDDVTLSRDGRLLVHALMAGDGGTTSLVRYDGATGSATPVEPFEIGHPLTPGLTRPVLSEDGSGLAFSGTAPDGSPGSPHAWMHRIGVDTRPVSDEGREAQPQDISADGAAVGLLSSHDLTSDTTTYGSTLHAYVAVGRVDELAPAWADPATALTATPGATAVQLSWVPALDAVGVTAYRVFRDSDSTPLATLPATTRSFTAQALAPETTYLFRIEAGDAAGNWSEADASREVTTTAAPVAGTALLAVTAVSSGEVRLDWEHDGTATGYRVLRRSGTGAFAEVATPSGNSYSDTGLDAETAYTWTVQAVDASGPRPHTAEASVTTPAIAAPSFDVVTPALTGGLLPLGGTVGLVVRGEPGRTAVVDVTRQALQDGDTSLSAPQPVTTTLGLVEDAAEPGTYRGALELVEGTTELTALTARLSDAAGHTASRASTRVPLGVSGRMAVTITGATGALSGARVEARPTSGAAVSRPVAADGPTLLPLADGDHSVRVLSGTDVVLGEAAATAVSRGRTTAVTVEARVPATVIASVRSSSGTPVPGVQVSLSDTTGSFLGYGTTDAQGRTTLTRTARSGTAVVTTVGLPWDSVYDTPPPSAPVVLDSETTTLELVLTSPGTGTITGLVRTSAGEPADGASVTAVDRGGRNSSTSTTTGPDGRYTLQVLSGDVELSVANDGEVAQVSVPVATDETVVRDVDLGLPSTYRVEARLLVQQPGAPVPTQPLALDWRTAVHFSTQLSAGQTSASNFDLEDGTTDLVAAPGDTLRFCANGREAGLPDAEQCVTKTLGAERTTSIELLLTGGARLQGVVKDAGGGTLSGYTVQVDRVTPQGLTAVGSQLVWAPTWAVGVPGPGSYRVQARLGAQVAGATVEVPGDGIVDVPDLVLREPVHFGGTANALTALRPEVLPGQLADLRAAFRNAGGAVEGAVLRVQVPAGSEAPAAGFLLDGKPVSVTPGEGHVDVPIGAVAAGAGGVVRYALRVPGTATAGQVLRAAAGMRVPGGSEEPLFPVDVTVGGLSLLAPEGTSSRTVRLSGRAVPGAAVEVGDGLTLLGATTASDPGGLWRLEVTLPDHGPTSEHQLVAASGDQRATRTISYDGSRPTLTGMSLAQIDPGFPHGREYSFDPRLGVAHFPFVFVPGQPMVVKAVFDRPQDVTSVVAGIGQVEAEAVRCGPATQAEVCEGVAEGTFVATMEIDGRGEVWLDYESSASPLTAVLPAPSVEQVRDVAPPELTGFTPLADQPGDGEHPETGSATASFSVPVPGESEPAAFQVTQSIMSNVHYEPTAEDLAREAQSGSPMMGLTYELGEDGTVTVTGYIPEDRLPADSPLLGDSSSSGGLRMGSAGTAGQPQRGALGFGGFSRKLISPVEALGRALKPAVKVVLKLKPLVAPVGGAVHVFGAKEKYEDIGDVAESLGDCTAEEAAPHLERVDRLLDLAAIIDATKAAALLSGAMFGLATLGTGAVAVGVASTIAIEAMKRDLRRRTKELEAAAAALPCSKKKKKKRAEPVWIYDPSGYVYEGVPSNRLQGVTTTLLHGPTPQGPWSVWQAEPFLQVNPLVTDREGRYAWDVPEGWWQVEYRKEGYEVGTSPALQVLPPQLDVNEGLVALADPTLTGAALADGGVTLTFDKHMRASSLPGSAVVVTAPDGAAVAGTLAPVSPETDTGATEPLSRVFRWTPAAPLAGGVHTVTVSGAAKSYSGRTLGVDAVRTVTVAVAAPPPPGPAPDPVGTPGEPGPGDPAPAASPTPSASPSPQPTGGRSPAASPPAASPAPPAPPALEPGTFRPLAVAVRALDTRTTGGPRTGSFDLPLPASVPSGAGVLLNVTVTNATRPGHVVVHPAGTPTPTTSNVNVVPGQTQANLVVTRAGADRAVTVLVHGTPANVIVDVVGHYSAGGFGARLLGAVRSAAGTGEPTGVVVTAPDRLLDTRSGAARTGQVLVRLPDAVPAEAKAVLLNVTATRVEGSGHVTAHPAGSAVPPTSNVNVTRGRTQANLVLVQVGADRSVALEAVGGPMHLIADLAGYQLGQAPALPPARVLDSRTGLGTSKGAKTGSVRLRLPDSVPSDASAVVLNLTVTGPATAGHVTVHPAGSSRPGTSNVNYRRGQTQANLVVTPVGPDRTVLLDVTGGRTGLVVDLMGVHPAG